MNEDKASASELNITLGLLKAVDENQQLTQRSAAGELGIALGLVNVYLKRCVKKGFIKVRRVPPRRYAYYLTPKGFAEKSRLTAEYLSQSLKLLREAQQEYTTVLADYARQGRSPVALCGSSDLTEIVILYCREFGLEIGGIWDPRDGAGPILDVPVTSALTDLPPCSAYLITDLTDARSLYTDVVDEVGPDKVFAPRFLELDRQAAATEDAR